MSREGSRNRVLALSLGLVAVALGAAAVSGSGWGGWSWATLAFVPVLVAASSLFVRVQFRDQTLALDLFEAALAPAIFVLAGPQLVITVCLSVAISEAWRRNTPIKAAFNVSQWAAAAAVGSAVMAGSAGGAMATRLGSLVLALVAVAVVNTVSFLVVVHVAQGAPLRQVAESNAPLIGLNWLVTTPVGLIYAVCYSSVPGLLPFFLLPLVLLHFSGRALAAARVDRARLEGLHQASLALHSSATLDVEAFLREVRLCFEAEVAELLVNDGTWVRVDRADGEGFHPDAVAVPDGLTVALLSVAPIRLAAGPDGLGPAVAAAGYRNCVAARVPISRGSGVLVVYNRGGLEGFDAGEMAVLEALGREVGQAMDKDDLFATVAAERSKLADIIGNASDGIVTLSSRGSVTSWNPGMEAITGFEAREVEGSSAFDRLRPRDRHGSVVEFGDWADRDLPADVQILDRDGAERWLSCNYTRVAPAEDGEPKLVLVARDSTRAHELEQLRDDFVSTVSHELRTPLTPIRGFASTLLEHGESMSAESKDEALKLILRQAQRLEGLIVNLLEVTRIEGSQGASLPSVVVDLTAIAHEVADDFNATHPNHQVRVIPSSAFAGVSGNQVWLERILINLVSNAIKYSTPGSPVEVRTEVELGVTRVTVTDRGPGIPPASQDRIFERFERMNHTHIQPGTGLGLYLARRLAEAMAGSLSVASEVGVGSTFTLEVPSVARLTAVS